MRSPEDDDVRRFARASVEVLVARRAAAGHPAAEHPHPTTAWPHLLAELDALRGAFNAALPRTALGEVVETAGLAQAEAELLAILVETELDEDVQRLIVSLTGDRERHRVELGMLPDLVQAGPEVAGPDVAGPGSRLRRAALVETRGRGAFGRTQLVLPARLLWYLCGDDTPDDALEAPVTVLTAAEAEPGWSSVLVVGADVVRCRQTAVSALGARRTLATPAPRSDAGWAALVREATLARAAVLIERAETLDLVGRRWVERSGHLAWALASTMRLTLTDLPRRDWLELTAPDDPPGAAEWVHVVGPDVERAHPLTATQLDTLALAMAVTGRDPEAAFRRLTDAKLDGLATHIVPRAGWDDLVLAPARKGRLRDLVDRYRQAHRVYDEWGFPASPSRGVVALFSGPSGTGKTLSAEVVAGELGLDLFRLDLSSVVSKYIGETEKNLDELFDAAAIGSTVLFFDEADSLFGKRTDVKDSHDRHANVGTSYLLQRLERYDGVVILCTNFEKNIDPAFLRRVHVRLEFAMPSVSERERLWTHNLDTSVPLADNIDLDFLSRQFDFSGAAIRNAVVDAAFLAAADGAPLGMEHLARGAARELQKAGRRVTEGEFGRWYDAAVVTTDA
jgi:SpoVK/Ycf46/Vps4 family AAA+-type ATPase